MLETELRLADPEEEAARVMQICNSCRYCETYCAVFPAMTRRLTFEPASIHFLANLCHNCGACLHACQYAAPHAFDVNVPRAMAQVRLTTYKQYAWPRALGALYNNNGLTLGLAAAGGIALFLILMIATGGNLTKASPTGDFYTIFPHNLLALVFGAAFGWAMLALGVGVARFWSNQSPDPVTGASFAEAARHALRLTYLDGGHGDGCNEESDRFTLVRRRFHHATFYGFLSCALATGIATVYHYAFQWHAPYALWSLPVIFGTLGGVGLIIGPAGLLWLNLRRHPSHGDVAQRPMDRAFIVLLLATSATGLGLLAWRATAAMPTLLALHLGCVLALFLTMPYSKFAHGIFRCAALLKWSVEKRQASRVKLAAD